MGRPGERGRVILPESASISEENAIMFEMCDRIATQRAAEVYRPHRRKPRGPTAQWALVMVGGLVSVLGFASTVAFLNLAGHPHGVEGLTAAIQGSPAQ